MNPRARSQSGKKSVGNASTSGSGATRSVASVTIPSRPSDPRIAWRRSGPAAEAGCGGSSSVPAGASTVPPAKSASIRPYPADCWPELRVATQPPTVESSQLCG